MATRFYLSATAAVFTPTTFRGTWGTTASAANGSLELGPIGAASTKAVAKTVSTNPFDVCMLRLVSQPAVAAATITGTLQLIMGAVETNASANDVSKIHAFVTTGASDTVRGTLLSNFVGATEFGTTASGVDTGAQAVTSTAVQAGDRLVIEIGYRSSTTNTTFTATVNLGNQGTTDLTSGSTSVTTLPGWVELSGADGIFATGAQLLADNFDDNSRSTTLWDYSYGTVTETGGRAQIAALAGVFSAYGSLPQYYLAGSLVAAQIVALPGGGGSSAAYAYMGCLSNIAGTALSWQYDPLTGNLSAQSQVAYTDATPTTLTYNATNHAWWRIRESAGTVSWDTSLDGLTWTAQRTLATPAWVTRCQYGQVLFEATRTGGSTSGTFEVDNLNTVLGMPAGQAAATGTANAATASLGAAAGQPAGTGTAYDGTVAGLPKVATVTDDFSTKDTAKWTFNGTADVVSGQVTSVPTSGYVNSVTSTATYDLTSSAMSVELVTAPAGNGSIGVFFNFYESVSGDVVGFYAEGGNLNFREIVGGSPSITSTTYNSTSHRWLRLTHDGTNLLWETSPDRTTWTTQRTKTPGRTWSVGAVQVNTGFYGTEPTPGTALFDNINFNPSTPVSANADLAAATGAAADAAVAVGAAAGAAAASGTADSPASSIAAVAGLATATGAASNARVAHTYYVDPAGSDGNDGYGTGTAWATVGKVNAASLGAGDVVLFKRGGTWAGTGLTIAGSGQAGSPITVSAYGSGALPIIDGGGSGVTAGTVDCITVTGSWVTVEYVEVRYASQYGILASGNDIELRSFTARGCPFGVQQNSGAARTLIHDFVAVDNNIGIIGPGGDDDTGGMGVVLQGSFAEVYNFVISGSAFTSPDYGIDGSGVEIYGATNALIRDGFVRDCISFTEVGGVGTDTVAYRNIEYTASLTTALAVYLQGTGAYGPVTNVTFTNCTLRLTGASAQGIGVGAGATVAIKNCVIDAQYSGFWETAQDEEHNVWHGYAGDILSTHHATQSGIAPTSVNTDPLFVDAAGGNLRLGNGSPAINLGITVAWTTDLDGSPRTVGAAPDAGAYEWQGPIADLAAGVGTAPAGTASVGANAGATAATGTSNDATAALDAAAGQAAGSGTAYDATAAVSAGAGQPTGAGTANDGTIAVAADSGAATGAGTADAGTAALTATPAEGAASGAAFDSSVAAAASADISSATGTAYDAAVTAASSPSADVAPASGSAADATAAVTATAGMAAATGTADDATTSTAAQAGVASGTGVAYDPVASTTAAADQPTATGVAYDATVTTAVAADAGAATASGASSDATADITATAGAAAGTGTADAPSASLALSADIATAAGAAADASITSDATAGLATATGAAFDATAGVDGPADIAAGLGTGYDTTVTTTAGADLAAATGPAYDATVNTSSSTSAAADPATAAGTALDGSTATAVAADVATASGVANDPTAGLSPAVDTATAAGVAGDVTVLTEPATGSAAATGSVDDAATAVTASAGVAQAVGVADDATATTSSSVNAAADPADATGDALDSSATITAAADTATATAAAYDPATATQPAADTAAAAGTAYDATATTAGSVNAPADTADATGVAPTAGVDIGAGPVDASATGAAYDATVAVGVSADPATAVGTIDAAAVWAAVDAAFAAGAATGWDGAALLGPMPDTAAGAGDAYDATVAQTAVADTAAAAGSALAAAADGPVVVVRAGRLTVRTRPRSHLTVRTKAT